MARRKAPEGTIYATDLARSMGIEVVEAKAEEENEACGVSGCHQEAEKESDWCETHILP